MNKFTKPVHCPVYTGNSSVDNTFRVESQNSICISAPTGNMWNYTCACIVLQFFGLIAGRVSACVACVEDARTSFCDLLKFKMTLDVRLLIYVLMVLVDYSFNLSGNGEGFNMEETYSQRLDFGKAAESSESKSTGLILVPFTAVTLLLGRTGMAEPSITQGDCECNWIWIVSSSSHWFLIGDGLLWHLSWNENLVWLLELVKSTICQSTFIPKHTHCF